MVGVYENNSDCKYKDIKGGIVYASIPLTT